MKTNYFAPKSRMLRRLFLGLVSLTAADAYVHAQALTGAKNIPGNYATIAAAVADLNTNGVGPGGVTFYIAAGYTETITAPISVTATGTLADPILFQKSGVGANPIVTAYVGTNTAGSATQDGIWNLAGSDYVTIDGIDLYDPNTSNPATMEYGYALYKASVSNGAQYNTIKNCVITMSTVNNAAGSGPSVDGSRGINVVNATLTAATTALAPTLRAGTNSYNNFFSNTIKNCNVGISIIGYAASSPFTGADTLNNIGGSSLATGNTILNFGGAAAAANPAAGIRTLAQYGINVSYNTINNNDGGGTNHPNTLRGIFLNTATSASGNCTNNTVTVKGGGTTSTIYAIDVEFGSTAASNTVNVNNNLVENCTYTTATSGSLYGIYAASTAAILNINGNIVRNCTVNASTGTLYGISWTSPAILSIINNQVYGLSRSGAGTTYGIYSASSSATEFINNNTVYDLTNTSTSSTNITIIGIYQNTVGGAKEVKNNTIYNFSATGSTATGNTITGMSILRGTPANIDSNLVYGFSGAGATVTGINLPAAIAGTYNAYNNKIYDLSSTIAAPLIAGITASGSTSSTTFNIYNNLIGDLRAPSASATDAIRGINITSSASTSNVNVFYNTVFLNASSSGTNFGTTGIYHTVSATATTATLNLKNNIIANLSTPAGTGLTVAYRRSGTALGNYGASSNNNVFYAGVPDASHLIFNDGTNSDQTLSAYKTRVATRDSISITENPTWASTAGNTTNFLNISTSIPTQLESKAAAITAIPYDFGGNVRQGNPGYPSQANGGGTAPDIGAWEFDGVPASAPSFSGLGVNPGVQCAAGPHTISATITNTSGTLSSVILNYSVSGVAQTPISMTNTSGNIWEGVIPAATPGNAKVTWSITATNTFSIAATSAVNSYSDEPLTGAVTGITASANPTCSGVPVQLNAIVAKAGGTAIVGAGATTSDVYPNPFYSLWSNTHNQYLITAAELSAAGLFAGNITSLAIEITVTNLTLNDLSIKMGHTNATNMSAFLSPTFTNVYSAATYVPVVGINTMTFSAPFNWDGVSNVVIEICHGNAGSGATMNSTAKADATPYVSTIHTHVSAGTAGSVVCSNLTNNLNTYSVRPRFIFGGVANSPLSSYSWSDGVTTVGNTNPLTVSPTTNTGYTFTATDINGCSVTHSTPYQVTVTTSSLSGAYNVGPGQTYTTLTAAINAYNNVCTLGGPVTFVLTDTLYSTAETFPITINNHRQASATNTLTIQPAANVSTKITGSSASSVLVLNAAKYVTINGSNNGTNSRNLAISNTNTGTSSAVIWMQNSFSGDSATHNTISNVIVNGNSNTTTLVGIGSGGTTISGSSLGSNNNRNTIRNCRVSKVQYGIYSAGASVAVKNQGNRIDSNELNVAAPDNIQLRGILVGFENNMTIVNNKVGNILSSSTTMGISAVTSTNTYTPTGNEITNALIEKNMVGPVTSTGGTTAFGIAIPAVTSGTNTLVNNSVFSVKSGATPSDFCAGIYIGGGAGSTTKLYFNSVSLSDAVTRSTPSAYAIAIGGTDPAVELKNNIFYNTQVTTGAGNSYAIGYASSAFTNLVSDYNLYYTSGANAQFAVTGGIGINTAGTIQANLAALKAATGKDVNSISADPLFASTLNLTPNLNSPMLGAGITVPGISTDITGATRATSPTIGSYENGADITAPVITYTALPNDINNPGTRTLTAFAAITDYSGVNTTSGTRPRIYYKKKSDANVFGGNTAVDNGWKWTEATNAATPFDFVINYSLVFGGFVNHQDTIQYFVTAQDNVAIPNTGANPSAGFSATSVSSIQTAPSTLNQYIIVNLPALNGPYYIGASQSSPNYTTISAAMNDLQLRGVSGPVTFYLTDASYSSGETFPIMLSQFGGASATNTVTIKPDVNVTATISGSNANAIIKFANKANYYVIDGSNNGTGSRNLAITNTLTSTSSVVWFEGLNAAEGVKNSVLKNTIIKGGANGTALGVLVGGATIGLSSNGAGTDSILIANNNIYNCYYGVVISGSSSISKIRNIEVYKNDIGTDTALLNNQYYGVYTAAANRIKVHHNHIYNLRTSSSINNAAIQISDNTTNSTFSHNRIHGIYSTSTGGYGAYGVNVASNTGVDNDSIYNNVIYDVMTTNYSTSSTTYNAFGIRLDGGSNLKIYYNSVNLYGQPTVGSSASASAAFLVLSNTYAGIDVRNNSFTNSMTGNTTGSRHYSFWTTLSAPIASAIFDYNNFYASGIHGVLMNGNGTDITSLANLRTATNANANSLSVTPYFTANDTLIPGAGMYSARGTAISTVQRDFLDTLRNTPPSIGAYEYDNGKDLQSPQISYAPIANSSSTSSYALNNFASITDNFSGVSTAFGAEPRLYYKKKYDGNQFLPGNSAADSGWKWVPATNATTPFSFTIDYSKVLGGFVNNFDSIYYFVTAQDNATPANVSASPSAGFAGSSVSSITAAPTAPGIYVIVTAPPMSGPYTVGATGTYTTIASALLDLGFRGVSGPVTFELTDASYSETYPLIINSFAGASSVNTLTIKPATGVDATISGSSASSIFRLNGADYVTINGSNNGSSSRNLTIENTNSATATAVIWGQTTSSGDSTTHNNLLNLNITGNAPSATLIGIGFGASAISNTSAGTNNNANTIQNCAFTKTQYAVYMGGTSVSVKDKGNIIRNNIMNASAPNNIGVRGIHVSFQDGIQISGNTIGNIIATGGTVMGISLGNNTTNTYAPTGNEVTNAVVSNNIIGPVRTGGGNSAFGIVVVPATSGTNVIQNNMISEIQSNATPSDFCAGIYVGGGTGSSTKVYYNTVALSGTTSTRTSPNCYALAIGSGDPTVDIRNNILFNVQTTTGTGNSYAIGFASTTFANLTLNYNNYFVAGANGILAVTGSIGVTGSGTSYNTLAAFKTATGKDANSINDSTRFVSFSDLHLASTTLGNGAYTGTPITGITTDIDGHIRNISYPYMGADESPTNPLPVKLLTFSASANGPDVMVTWATASETNNAGFEVERSSDGKTFASIGFVKGAGNSKQINKYRLNDNRAFALSGSNVLYYRLKQLDLDGNETVSKAVLVRNEEQNTLAGSLVYPNPFESAIAVELFSASDLATRITMVDIAGKVVLTKEATLSEGMNRVAIDGLAELNKGVYFVHIVRDGKTEVHKLIKN